GRSVLAFSEKLSFYHCFGAAWHRTLENSAFITVLRSSSETQKNQPLSMFWIAPPPPHSGALPPLFGKLSLYHCFGSRFLELPCAASSRESAQKSKRFFKNSTLLYFSLPYSIFCAVRRAAPRAHPRRRRSLRSASMIIYRPMRKALVSFLTLAA